MNEVIENKTIYIFNILRSLGLNTSLKATKLLNKAIQIVLLNDDEFIFTNKIFIEEITRIIKIKNIY